MKLKSAMLKMNTGYTIRCAAIGPRFFKGGGLIAGNELLRAA
jgi:hypothetical protein